jgi:hypothetical protein
MPYPTFIRKGYCSYGKNFVTNSNIMHTGKVHFPSSLLPLWSIGMISQFLDHSQTVGLLGRVISSSHGLCLNTETRTPTHTSNIQVLSGSGTHDPVLRASEDSACLRLLGYRDRHQVHYRPKTVFGAFLRHKISLRLLLHERFWHVLAISHVAVWKQLRLIQCFARIR